MAIGTASIGDLIKDVQANSRALVALALVSGSAQFVRYAAML